MENETLPGDNAGFLEESVLFNFGMKVTLAILHSLVFIFCFFGNLAVLAVLCFHWKMRGPTKFCLANLAFSNLCVGTFCIYQHLFSCLTGTWIFGNLLCKFYYFISSLSQTSSILILVVIAVERYLAIKEPMKTRQMLTLGRLKMVIVGVWIVSAIISSPRLYFFHTFSHPIVSKEGEVTEQTICTLDNNIYDSKISDPIHFLLLFLIPLLIISILYWRTYLRLCEREHFVNSFSQPSSVGRKLDERRESMAASENSFSSWRNSGRAPLSLLRKLMNRSGKLGEREGEVGAEPKLKMSCQVEGDAVDEKKVLNKGSGNNVSLNASRENSARNMVCHSRKRVLKMLIAIVLTFALCNLPMQLRKIYLYLDGRPHWWIFIATPITRLLLFANCAINPILYAFMSPSFRSCFKDCMRGQVKRPSVQHRPGNPVA